MSMGGGSKSINKQPVPDVKKSSRPDRPKVYYNFWGQPYVKREELLNSKIVQDTIAEAGRIREELRKAINEDSRGESSKSLD